jgi:hypothetical protein
MQSTKRNKREVSREDIERRAYEIYLQRGGMDGGDTEDWLIAEKELCGGEDLVAGTSEPPEEEQRRRVAAGGRSPR